MRYFFIKENICFTIGKLPISPKVASHMFNNCVTKDDSSAQSTAEDLYSLIKQIINDTYLK